MRPLLPAAIAECGLFDRQWYLAKNADVARIGMDPVLHYLKHGWKERRNPHPLFDVSFYLEQNPDVAAIGIEPLRHYLSYGFHERRRPHPYFDPREFSDRVGSDGLPDKSALLQAIEAVRVAGAHRGVVRARPLQPIALMVSHIFPRYDQSSAAIDQLSFAKIFQGLGFEVHYLALDEFHEPEAFEFQRYRAKLQSLGGYCVGREDCRSSDDYFFRFWDRISVAFLSHHFVASRVFGALRYLCPSTKIIFNTVDLAFLREERQSKISRNKKLLRQAQHSRHAELGLIESADASIVVSRHEKELLGALGLNRNVFFVPLLREFVSGEIPGFPSRRNITFIGGYNHAPNVDAVEYFLDVIWPKLHARRPEIEFLVVGANLPARLAKRKDPHVRFIGYVEDLNALLAQVTLTVAPLRYGAGAKGKVVASLGQGVPCIASAAAAEGMDLEDGVHLSVAQNPDHFVELICELYEDESAWTRRSRQAQEYIRREYSVDSGFERVLEILDRIGVPRNDATRESIEGIEARNLLAKENNGGRDRD